MISAGNWLAGEGRLYQRLLQLAGDRLLPMPDVGTATNWPKLVVSAHDRWMPDAVRRLQRQCRAAGAFYLHCRLEGLLGFIGPCVHPTSRGCAACAEYRRRALLGTADGVDCCEGGLAAAAFPLFDALARMMLEWMADPVVGLARVFVMGGDFAGQWHKFLPVPGCVDCSRPTSDSRASAELTFEPRPQPDPTRFRLAEEPPPLSALRDQLVDWRYGVVANTWRVESAPLALSAAEVGVGGIQRETGYGRAGDFDGAEQVALLEALERHAGGPPQRETLVRASYSELADEALDPLRLGLPSIAPHPDAMVPYSPDLTLDWVWAWSTQRRAPTLVPEQVAYYRVPHGRGGKPPRFLYESSNGCALGGCLEEAIVHGILEVAERDAFLMAWYGQLPVGELGIQSLEAHDVEPLIDKAMSIGYEVHVFDITNDLEIPAVWALVVSEDDSRPKSFSAAAAHPDPNRAVAAALYEAIVYTFVNQRPDKLHDPARLRRMLDSPAEVRTLDDHVALYTLPEAYERFAHLFAGAKKRSITEAFPAWRDRWVRNDLGECLRVLLDHFHRLGLDVLVVDQTTDEQQPLGLRTVKVIVPGTLPMTFGHINHRTRGLDRLLEVPAKLGMWPSPRRYEELTIHPHPFP